MTKRIGVVGFGKLGQFLAKRVLSHPELSLEFIWNRSSIPAEERPHGVPILDSLADVEAHKPDLIVEVAHPLITQEWGSRFLSLCDYMVGSPTAFGQEGLRTNMLAQAAAGPRGLFIPQGAMIGLGDLLLASRKGRVASLKLTMEKTPDSIKYQGPLEEPLCNVTSRKTIYEGAVGPLCSYAPNNINTMAVATMASGLPFDRVQAELVVDPGLKTHIVKMDVLGPEPEGDAGQFSLSFQKDNPAAPGAVTGSATYDSFFHSIIEALEGRAFHSSYKGVYFS